jgi:hypothetical protein
MAKSMCIMCGKERGGLPVIDDPVLRSLRWIKRNITKNPKNFELVVCKECFLNYKKKREGYERKMIIYIVLGIIFTGALAAVADARLSAIAVGLVITLFLLLLAQFSYLPAVKMPNTPSSQGRKKK